MCEHHAHAPAALASLLLCTLAAAAGARRLWPDHAAAPPPSCAHAFGVQLGVEPLRVLCLERPRASAGTLLRALAPRSAQDGAGVELRAGELLVVDEQAVRRAPLPAQARFTLGLPLDLNTASAADLDELPRLGKVVARRVVEERQRRGGFRSVDELRAVRGIGRVTLERLRPWLAVEPAD